MSIGEPPAESGRRDGRRWEVVAVVVGSADPAVARPIRGALAVHIAMLPLYALWVWLGAFSQFKWAGALGLGAMWLLIGWFVLRWAREGRQGIAPRVVLWGLLAWFNLLLVLPLLWEPTRRFLVPARAEQSSTR